MALANRRHGVLADARAERARPLRVGSGEIARPELAEVARLRVRFARRGPSWLAHALTRLAQTLTRLADALTWLAQALA